LLWKIDGNLFAQLTMAAVRRWYEALVHFWDWLFAYPGWTKAKEMTIRCGYDQLAELLRVLLMK